MLRQPLARAPKAKAGAMIEESVTAVEESIGTIDEAVMAGKTVGKAIRAIEKPGTAVEEPIGSAKSEPRPAPPWATPAVSPTSRAPRHASHEPPRSRAPPAMLQRP